jgi:hypothetical protein
MGTETLVQNFQELVKSVLSLKKHNQGNISYFDKTGIPFKTRKF